LPYVVSVGLFFFRFIRWTLTRAIDRHASIDPAVRAARNLPEDLIRLCVGIEDAEDLIDDLESALLEAGAIQYVEDGEGGRRLVRVRSSQAEGDEVTKKLEQIELDSRSKRPAPKTLITSAPGKVILFGEHAVVHGIVRNCFILESIDVSSADISLCRLPLLVHWLSVATAWSNRAVITKYLF
jgi:hypothetical protein